MNTHSLTYSRPALATWACVNERCTLCGHQGQNNPTELKIYGQDGIHNLRCCCCGDQFSERKNTELWNTKLPEAMPVTVTEQMAKDCSLKATTRWAKVYPNSKLAS